MEKETFTRDEVKSLMRVAQENTLREMALYIKKCQSDKEADLDYYALEHILEYIKAELEGSLYKPKAIMPTNEDILWALDVVDKYEGKKGDVTADEIGLIPSPPWPESLVTKKRE